MSRARGAGALAGFGVAFWASRRAGLPLDAAALRGLLGAVALSLVGWWSALLVIRGLMRAAVAQAAREAAAAQAEAAAARAAAGGQAGAPAPGPTPRPPGPGA